MAAELAPRPPAPFELDRRRGGIEGQHRGDALAERVRGVAHQRILRRASRLRRARRLGLADRVAEPRVDQPLLHRGAVRPVERLPDRAHRALGGGGRLARDAGRDLVRPRPELVARDDLGHQPDAQRRLGRDALVVAGERDAERLAEADPAHEADRLERRHHAVRHVRVEEGRVRRADDDVGLVDEVERARGAHALHGADDRLPDLLPLRAQQLAGVLVVPHVVGLAVLLLDVEPGAERPVAGGAQHDGVDRRIVLDPPPRGADLLAHLPVEGVQRVRPVERDRGDAVGRRLVADGLVGRAHRHFHSRRALLDEGARPLAGVLGADHALAERLGEDLRLVQRQVEALADREARAADGERGVAIDDRRDLARALEEPLVRHHLGHQAEVVRALRAEPLVAAGERDAHRDVERQHARETHHLAPRHEPDADVRVEELGALGRDGDVAGGHQVEPGAAAEPVHRGQDGLGHRPERRRRLLRRLPLRVGRQVGLVVDHAAVVGDLRHVGSGAERAAGAGHEEDPHRVVGLGRRVRGAQLAHHERAHRVQPVGTVQRDRRDAVADLVEDGLELHGRLTGP